MLIVALALGLIAPVFDFDHRGVPVARVVEAMGKAYGVEMSADATMKRDVVIVALLQSC